MQEDWYKIFFSKENFVYEKKKFLGSWQLAAHVSEIRGVLHLTWVEGFITLKLSKTIACLYFPNGSEPLLLQSKIIDGFIFIRLSNDKSEDGITQMTIHPHTKLFKPLGALEERYIDVNWKLLVDISLDETHVKSIHPECSGLLGGAFDYIKRGNQRSWKQKLSLDLNGGRKERRYYQLVCLMLAVKLRYWEYHWIFPATEIEIYPEQVAYYQIIPISQRQSLKRHRRLGRSTLNPICWWMRSLNRKIQESLDVQDIETVLARSLVTQSIEDIRLYPGQGDNLVLKFHESIQS